MLILIVDDSSAARMIVKKSLRQAGFGGHTVIEAGNGLEALEAIAQDAPDLLLTDWAMPEMTGIELLRALQEQGKKLNSVLITSQGTDEMREEARAAGALFLLTKPLSSERFREALEPVLG
ncbi:MAG: response regulator [Planctomycetes bacterium]|nr:response regulator [Planctomycetota bacterium]